MENRSQGAEKLQALDRDLVARRLDAPPDGRRPRNHLDIGGERLDDDILVVADSPSAPRRSAPNRCGRCRACRGRCRRRGNGRAVCPPCESPRPGSSPRCSCGTCPDEGAAGLPTSATIFRAWSQVLMKSVSKRFSGSMQIFLPLSPAYCAERLEILDHRAPLLLVFGRRHRVGAANRRINRPDQRRAIQHHHLIDDRLMYLSAVCCWRVVPRKSRSGPMQAQRRSRRPAPPCPPRV